MAVLVVMLVITMLTGVALFAARSAVGNTDNAGRYRQLVQTHNLSEMATTVTIGEVGRDPQSYSDRIKPAVATPGKIKCKLTVPQRTECAQMGYSSLKTLYSNNDFVLPKVPATGPNSLGFADTRADFFIELVGNERVPMPPGGYSATNDIANTLTFRRITILASAMVLPESATATGVGVAAGVPTAAELASVRHMSTLEATRANIIIGPIQ